MEETLADLANAPSDEDLVQRARTEPLRPAFQILYQRHEAEVFRFLLRLVRDRPLAEDLLQETFLRAYRHLDRFETNKAFRPWLFAIARNKIHSYLRDRKPTVALPDAPASTAGPLETLSRAERSQSVRDAVDRLDPDLREAIVLRYEGGLGYASIADRLDLPVSTIQGRLKRARWALKKALEGEEIRIQVDLGRGRGRARLFTCDLSYDYVKINAEYTT